MYKDTLGCESFEFVGSELSSKTVLRNVVVIQAVPEKQMDWPTLSTLSVPPDLIPQTCS